MFLQKARSLVDSTEQINNNNYHYIMKNKTKQISLSFFFYFAILTTKKLWVGIRRAWVGMGVGRSSER